MANSDGQPLSNNRELCILAGHVWENDVCLRCGLTQQEKPGPEFSVLEEMLNMELDRETVGEDYSPKRGGFND